VTLLLQLLLLYGWLVPPAQTLLTACRKHQQDHYLLFINSNCRWP
jgi:hypothetical protein